MPFSGSSFSGDSFAGEGPVGGGQPSTNVDLRYQWRLSSDVTWTGEFVVELDSDTLIGGLDEGEEYDVRVRTETDHVTGAWSPVATETTGLPSPDDLTAEAVGDTQIDLDWTLTSDDEDGVKVFRAERIAAGFGAFEELADLASGTESYSDTTAEAATAYRYYVQPYTEHVTEDSETVDVTTTGRRYWAHVGENSIDLNHLGSFDFEREHSAISTWGATTPYDQSLEDFRFEPIRFYLGDEFLYRGIADTIGSDTSQNATTLSGVGPGDALRRGEATVQFTNVLAWRALRTYLQDHSPISAGTVTEPEPLDSVTGQTLASHTSNADFDDVIRVENDNGERVRLIDENGNRTSAGSTYPFAIRNGNVELLQTCFFVEAEDDANENGVITDDDGNIDPLGTDDATQSGGRGTSGTEDDGFSGPDASNGWVLETDTEWLEFTFSNEYTIPGSSFGVNARLKANDTNGWKVDVILEDGGGQEVDHVSQDPGTTIALGWDDVGDGRYDGDGWSGGDIPPGTHTVRFEVTDGGAAGEQLFIDCLAVYDQRYSYTFDNSVDGNDALSGPEKGPSSEDFFFEVVESAYRVTTVDIDSTHNDTTNNQALDYSVDSGATFEGPFANTSTVDDSPSAVGASVLGKVTLGRYTSGTPTTTPTSGNALQNLQEWQVDIDGELNAVISDLTVDATHFDNIAKLANRAGMRWVIDFDEDTAWIDAFRRDDRVGVRDWTVLDHARKYDGEGYANHVTVKGARQDDGSRLKSVAAEPSEFDVGVRRYTTVKPAIDSQEDLDSLAETVLQERLDEDRITGTQDIVPEPVTPGYSYPIGEWDSDVAQGGYALDFDGDDDYVKVPGPDQLQFDPTTDDITFACRFKPDELVDGQRLLAKESHEADVRLRIGPNDDLVFTVDPDTGSPGFFDLVSNATLETGTWYTVVGVFDADSGATLYIDGTEDNSNTTTFSSASADSAVPDLFIGASRPGFLNFNGIVDDVVVDMSAWSAAKVDRYAAGIVPSDVLVHFPFNEGSGTTTSGFIEAPDSFDYTFDFTFHTPTPIGTINGATWVGTEVPLERVRYAVDGTRLDGTLHFEDQSGLGQAVVGVGDTAKDSRDAL